MDSDTVSRRLLGLLLKRLEQPPPDVTEMPETATEAAYSLILVGVDGSPGSVVTLRRTAALAAGAGRARLAAMIARDSDDLRCACLHAGADEVLVKPLALADLAELLDRAASAKAGADFDPATWAKLLHLFGRRGAHALVQTLVDDLPVQRERVATAIRNRDLAALKRVAHSLRGTSLQLGATALAELCTRTELAAVADDCESALGLGAAMIGRHAALVERLRREPGPTESGP